MGAVWIIFSIVAYTQIGGLPAQSALFPKVIVYGIGITGVLIIIDSLVKVKKGIKTDESTLTKSVLVFQILIPGSLLFITYNLLTVFGFYVSGFFLIMAVFFYQTYRANNTKMNLRHFLRGLIFATLNIATMYIIFTVLLGLPVPRGSFFN
ncbi:tripartite tricarboxylate transporter TctB family protein [Alkaliphilus metalliredigens]|nr:tripartite tricarboxylate transporter TctB family protein [Alkaliphilus metalliredigens]